MQVRFLSTLRARLVMAILVVQCGVLGGLLVNVNRIWSEMVVKTTEVRAEELARLLNAALAPSLAALDYTPATELLDGVRTPDGIDYLVLFDHQGKLVAARGWDADKTPPKPDRLDQVANTRDLPSVIHMMTPIEMAGQRYGTLHFGISTELLRDSANQLVWQSVGVMLVGAVVSAALLAMLGFFLTRRLYRLIEATEENATADTPGQIQIEGNDEVSQLTRRFNQMAAAIQERIDALRRSEERFAAIADYTYSAELWLDACGQLVWANASVTRLTGYTIEECMAMREFPAPLAAAEERSRVQTMLREAVTGTSGQDFEFRAQRRDGKLFWATMSWQPIYDAAGNYLGIRASIMDDSQSKDDRLALKRAVFELQQSQALGQHYLARAEAERVRLLALLEAMRFGVLFVDQANQILFHNTAFRRLWLIDEATVIAGRPMGQVLQASLNRPPEQDLTPYLEVNLDDAADMPSRLTMNDGRILTQQVFAVRDDHGAYSGRLWIFEDVTQEQQLNERMVFLAERDALTGLYNRHAFSEQLESRLADADRAGEKLAVLYFDLDEFKYVNDTFGHGAGDDLLKRVAQEVSSQVRRNELFARLGGDEFAILISTAHEEEVRHLANRVVSTVAAIQFMVDGQPLRLSSSLGVAFFPEHARTAEDLVAHADTAMYQAKAAGKATWRVYKAEQDPSREMVNRLTWNERIQRAIEHDGFVLYFQGIYDTRTRQVAHIEALLRMPDPDRPGQIIPPGQFIPHAERSGRILEIDRWVVAQVIRLLAAHPELPPVAVNISGRSFDGTGLPDYIHALLSNLGVDPQRLMVELTETAAVSDMRDAQRFIEALRQTGCTVCLDDFGAGFSSFAYLKHLKAQVLKIDGIFIRDLPRDHDSQVFVKGMASIARDMGKLTVAEFVEDAETLAMLAEFGVDMVQGYYLDKPQPLDPDRLIAQIRAANEV